MPFPASQLVELAAGHQLDRYELISLVAQGGMASVWLARLRGKHGFEKLVALKTILPSLAEDKRFRRMLLDEARIAARIEHINVAQTLDLGEQDGHLYLVMEWVDGDSLSKLDRALEKAGLPLPLPILLRVMVDACAGLHAAHELCDDIGRPLGVVHRDVSPQNILVSAKGQAKLIDFGIAKAQTGPSEETRAGVLKGKIHYMPPEQAARRRVDRRTDVWAVGAVLYRMLSRRTPYESQSPVESLRLLTSFAPPAPLPVDVDAKVAALVMKALSPEPAHRFATALELQEALEQLATQCGGLATSQELASFVTQYLGASLQERREKLSRALRSATDRDTVVQPVGDATATDLRTKDTTPDRPLALDPDTGVLQPSISSSVVTLQMPSRAPEPPPRSRWGVAVAALGVFALGAWGLSSRQQAPVNADAATTPTSEAPAANEPPASSQAPASGEAPASNEPLAPSKTVELANEPPVVTLDELLPPPVLPSALPLSKARPVFNVPAAKPKVKAAPRPASAAPPQRKVVDDGF